MNENIYRSRRLVPGVSDLQSLYPEVADQLDRSNGENPENIYAYSTKKFVWICEKQHRWTAQVLRRTKYGSKCPYCTGKWLLVGENDLSTTHKALLQEWDYEANGEIRPEMFLANSVRKVHWVCARSHRWEAPIRDRALVGRSCPYCNGQRLLPGVNDLESVREDLIAEWDYTRNEGKPSDYFAHSNKVVYWVCKKDPAHKWKASINGRRSSGCPYCAGKRCVPGVNDFSTLYPEIAAEWSEKNGELPPDHHPGSIKKVWWKCTAAGHMWRIATYNRTALGTGCPYCSGRRKVPKDYTQ